MKLSNSLKNFLQEKVGMTQQDIEHLWKKVMTKSKNRRRNKQARKARRK